MDDEIPTLGENEFVGLTLSFQEIPALDNGLIIYLDGHLDSQNSFWFKKQIDNVINSGYIKLIFQMEKYKYIASPGLGTFTSFFKSLKPIGGDLCICNLSPQMYEVFQLLGFSAFFSIYDDIDSSIDHFLNV